MLNTYKQFYIQKKDGIKYPGLHFNLNANETVIGTIQENEAYAKKAKNHFWKLISSLLLNAPKRIVIESLRLDILDIEDTLLGYIHKGVGLNKDLLVHNAAGEHIATVQSNVKMKAPSIQILNASGDSILHATSSYGATDFTITTASEFVATIKKRSLVYETIKDTLFNYDVYHVHQPNQDATLTLILIATTVAIDLHFFAGE